ncbi:hypothetical protein [Pseudomonas faucium]|uniref:hypothetical protein n=1 Tax=Pseudomonas faucium TaxID=2740518 RepID=UPI001F3F3344|nr:hypothetical protein [Pseudomonas faucium]
MDKHRKLVIRSLQKMIANRHLQQIKAHGNSELFQDFKVHNELLLREVLGETTLRRYLKAVGIATRKRIGYDNSMTVGDLVDSISKP